MDFAISEINKRRWERITTLTCMKEGSEWEDHSNLSAINDRDEKDSPLWTRAENIQPAAIHSH